MHFFQSLDYKNIYNAMMKPAYVFDGRNILDHDKLTKLGFQVHTIGKQVMQRCGIKRSWGSINQV